MRLLSRYPLILVTLVVFLLVAVLLMVQAAHAGRVAASLYALGVAAYLSVRMLRRLRDRKWGIDALAISAIASTVFVGEYIASMIIVVMLAGGAALEDFAAGRAKGELSALLEHAPRVSHRETDGQQEDVDSAVVAVGDVLLIRPAEVVPLDGQLLSVAATLDESSLTGESLPVERYAGEKIMSGSVNGEAAARIRVTARLEDSQYSRIISLVREASESRAPMVRMADRYAVPFTILAYAIGALAWFTSGSVTRFAEVLVVATPCPLLIAAPVAFLGGMSRAAKSGIIVKSAGVLEQLSRVRTAAFDKTGTLTYGRPALAGIRLAAAVSEEQLLRLAASAEQYSSHVLANSVVEAALARGLALAPATEATEFATHGVRAFIEGEEVAVGKPSFVAQTATGVVETEISQGELAIYVGIAGLFAGVLIMSDPLRREARRTLSELKALGVTDTLMLTGDARATADHIAREAGLDTVQAECLPPDKVEAVRSLPNRPVMMVGDGVNDAPVLAAADVGIAMGARGSTAAGESADVVIIPDDLSKAALAVQLGQRTVQVARQSMWIGIGLSVGLMLTAAAGYIPAVAGALGQEAVDLATILNALRALGRSRAPDQPETGRVQPPAINARQ